VFGFSYQGPRSLLYQSVWVTSAVSACLLVALRVIDKLTPNDFALGLLLTSVERFAFGLGILASLLFLVLLVFRDVSKSVKLRALGAASLPYIVLGILYLITISSSHPRK
jgi:hypothetical protein